MYDVCLCTVVSALKTPSEVDCCSVCVASVASSLHGCFVIQL